MPAYTLISYYHDRPDGSALHFNAANDAAARIEATNKIRERGEKPALDSKWELLSDDADDASLGFYEDDGAPMVGAADLLPALKSGLPQWRWSADNLDPSMIRGSAPNKTILILLASAPAYAFIRFDDHESDDYCDGQIKRSGDAQDMARRIAEFLAELA